jgi:hypothetical protein
VAFSRVVLASVIVALVGLADGSAVLASCIGPTIEHTAGRVDRSGVIHVVGSGWGDECDDTGAPPEGVGVLGNPETDIEVVLVQGENPHVVATGDADADYRFVVDVPVPDRLAAGPVTVVARGRDGTVARDATAAPIVVSDAPPVDGDDDDPVTFGRPRRESPDEAALADDDGPAVLGLVVVGVAVVGLTTAVVVLLARARRGPTGPRAV